MFAESGFRIDGKAVGKGREDTQLFSGNHIPVFGRNHQPAFRIYCVFVLTIEHKISHFQWIFSHNLPLNDILHLLYPKINPSMAR